MKGKQFFMLFVVAAVLVIAAIMSTRRGTQSAPEAIGRPLLPDFDASQVASIEIKTREATATMKQENGTWGVSETFGYPVDFTKLRNAMTSLQSVRIADVPRLSSEKREALGVVAPPGGHAKTTSITFSDSGGAVLVTLLLGKEHMREVKNSPAGGYPDGRYVSSDGGETIYFVSEAFGNLSSQPQNWIDKSLLKVDASDLTRVVITSPGSDPIELSRGEDDASLELAGLGDDETLDTTELSSIRNALSYFDLVDVASPTLTDGQVGLTNASTFLAETDKGIAYAVTIGGQAEGNSRHIRIAAAKIELPETDKEDAAGTENAPDVQTEVDTLNQKFSPWTFIIPGYKADAMLKTREDLAKPKEDKPEDQADNEDSPGAAPAADATTEAPVFPADASGSGTKK